MAGHFVQERSGQQANDLPYCRRIPVVLFEDGSYKGGQDDENQGQTCGQLKVSTLLDSMAHKSFPGQDAECLSASICERGVLLTAGLFLLL